MTAFTPQQQKILLQKMNGALDKMERHFEKSLTPAAQGAALGAQSATGSEQQIEDSNRRLKNELSNPIFSKNYFAAQRLTRNKIVRSRTL